MVQYFPINESAINPPNNGVTIKDVIILVSLDVTTILNIKTHNKQKI